MDRQEILKKVDHTLLTQTATWKEIKEICDDAIKYQTASICIPPSYVKEAKAYVQDQMAVCTVIGFPNGYNTTAVKKAETEDALKNGADEIDMVINIGWVKDKKFAQIEEEISELDEDERKMFLEDLGLKESGLEKLVKASYHLLGLMSFLTSGEDETRAWTIKIGTKAPQAAGKIHSDFERGFIKAEVVNYQDLLDCGSYAGAREKGLVRMEGKEYVVQDGDVILFRFNV
jgi:hypothetical protein